MLTDVQVTPQQEIWRIVKGLKAGNLRQSRARLIKLLDQVS